MVDNTSTGSWQTVTCGHITAYSKLEWDTAKAAFKNLMLCSTCMCVVHNSVLNIDSLVVGTSWQLLSLPMYKEPKRQLIIVPKRLKAPFLIQV